MMPYLEDVGVCDIIAVINLAMKVTFDIWQVGMSTPPTSLKSQKAELNDSQHEKAPPEYQKYQNFSIEVEMLAKSCAEISEYLFGSFAKSIRSNRRGFELQSTAALGDPLVCQNERGVPEAAAETCHGSRM